MVFKFRRNLSDEMQELDVLFNESILPWEQEMEIYMEWIDGDHTWRALPPIVFSIYRGMGLNKDFSLSMANIFKILYLSVFIHELIHDDEEGQEYNQHMQFSILIGDYMFGRIMALLIDAEADMLLPLFADLICEINEGMVRRYKLGSSRSDYIASSRASLYKSAFLTAAYCAGKGTEEQNSFQQAGSNLGIAVEFLNHDQLKGEALTYLEASVSILMAEPQNSMNTFMGPIYREIQGLLSVPDKMAAV
ncbi:MAG: hypothetical protein GX119_02685 [Syntrophomonadaceae bacterium]|jgi:hypothetical protein|nr:hypothetical protein [Syntrophomonadaceae bacterium]